MPKNKVSATVQELTPMSSVDAFMLSIQQGSIPQYRQPQIRASSMPFCPLLFSLSSGHGSVDFGSQFYFSVGTAVHEGIQKYGHRNELGMGMLWGDWKCTACGEVKHHHCLKPEEACSCGSNSADWEYEEVTIEYNGISGHIDTILMVKWHKNPKKRRYVIVDYKTTASYAGRLDAKKYPFRGNVIQISLYACVMKEKYGINVVGYSLIYVDRSRPIRSIRDYVHVHQEWNDIMHARMKKKLAWVSSRIPMTQKVWNRLHTLRQMPSDKDIQDMVDNRPCQSVKQWEGWMAANFEREFEQKDRVCPHLDTCVGGCKTVTKHFTKLYKGIIKNV